MFCILSFPFLFLLVSMLLLPLLAAAVPVDAMVDRFDPKYHCNAAQKGREVGTGRTLVE